MWKRKRLGKAVRHLRFFSNVCYLCNFISRSKEGSDPLFINGLFNKPSVVQEAHFLATHEKGVCSGVTRSCYWNTILFQSKDLMFYITNIELWMPLQRQNNCGQQWKAGKVLLLYQNKEDLTLMIHFKWITGCVCVWVCVSTYRRWFHLPDVSALPLSELLSMNSSLSHPGHLLKERHYMAYEPTVNTQRNCWLHVMKQQYL